MAHEFDELILDGHNYPTWALDVGSWLLLLLMQRERQHFWIHTNTRHYTSSGTISTQDLKSEYVMEEESHSLWVALKGRYEQ
jgi:hypothetical protein